MPISVSEFVGLAEQALKLYEDAEEQMIGKIAKRLSKGQSSTQWQQRKMSEMSSVSKEMKGIVKDLQKYDRKYAKEMITSAYFASSNAFVSESKMFADITGISALSANSPKVISILYDLNKTMNAAERTILRNANDAYANIVGRASAKVATGTITVREAVKQELKEFADKGITSFVDKNGRTWDMATYAEMATLTAIERATIEGYIDTMKYYGYDLAIISSHAGACPICVAWEDVIISVSGDNDDYPSYDDAVADGVFHPRCMHYLSTYYEGITKGGKSHPEPVRESSYEYTSRQKQRYYERQVRKWKRRMAVATDPLEEREAYARVRLNQKNIRTLMKNYHGKNDKLVRKYYREGGAVRLTDAAKKFKPIHIGK